MKINYQLVCEKKISELTSGGKTPRLLLHSCCGPCSSYVLEYLTEFFDVTVLFFNPNIYPVDEYTKRLETQKKLLSQMKGVNKIEMLDAEYCHEEFLSKINGLENEREGGSRCTECFMLRLEKTAEIAKKHGFDCFATTLSVSPHKNAEILNEIGEKLEKKYGVCYLKSDFKKKEGYKRSIELSRKYDLYRQEYCGCEFSLKSET